MHAGNLPPSYDQELLSEPRAPELAVRLNKTLNEGDLDGALQLSCPDAVVYGLPDPGERRLQEALAEPDRWIFEIDGLVDAGPEVVIAAVTAAGEKLFHVFRFRGGRLSELHACPDFLAALSAAGIDDSLD